MDLILDLTYDDTGYLQYCRIPKSVATCPCCDSELIAGIEEWETVSKLPTDCGVKVDCSREECYQEYKDSEYWRMPYVYWLPVETTVKRWLFQTLN